MILEPDRKYVVNFSGGRTSAYMLRVLLDTWQGIPENVVVIFANTGRERAETYDFVHEVETRWNVPIVWLEYQYNPEGNRSRRNPKHSHNVVNYETASRAGEPFELACHYYRMLPNVMYRFCTRLLKIGVVNTYTANLDWKKRETVNILGIRADEKRRINKALFEECRVAYPLVDLGVTECNVLEYWRQSDFGLALPPGASNCDYCFLMRGKGILRERMNRPNEGAEGGLQWWIDMEDLFDATFIKGLPYSVLRQTDEKGERVIEDETSCFCGD